MDESPAPTFADLGLRPELLDALTSLGYEEPTPIQREAIGPLVAGRDVLGQAATGTGKTAAFALPLLQALEPGRERGGPAALVLVPTRELANQVSEAVHKYGRGLGARILPVYGGQPFGRQAGALRAGVDVVVATPGRAVDHLGRGTLDFDGLRTVVLDEADEMLDMGFAEDIETLLEAAPAARQTVLFSATMPPRIASIADAHLRDPVHVEVGRTPVAPGQAPKVRQLAYLVRRPHKAAALGRVLDVEQPEAALVFCRTRDEVDTLTETLNGRGYRAEALHGGMSQEQRDRVMGRLRSGTAELLVATDVAARGLDVETLTHVINVDVPSAPEAYVHRIGRVGRAGRTGTAITLADPREHRQLRTIERVTGTPLTIERLPTVADLRARRLELVRAALAEHLDADDLDSFRVVVEALADEHDLMDIALAAVRLAHQAAGGEGDDEEIPAAHAPRERDRRERERQAPRERSARPAPADLGPTSRIWIGAGREAGVRPQDLVGAITGETGLQGRQIGSIHIAGRFSLVELPEEHVDDVVAALGAGSIRGRRVKVRRDREPQR
jgi:ATP-dependent RNA helicase DeaD